MNNNGYKYVMPLVTLIGRGSLSGLGNELSKKNAGKALIVTDKFMESSGKADNLGEGLKKYNIDYAIFNGVKPNPTLSITKDSVNKFLSEKCNCIISLGGGSAHDTAKAIKIVLQKNGVKDIVLAAVNTTAGTGSEITKFCVLTDEVEHHKIAIVQDDLVPDIAVDDPELMLELPKSLTSTTGMDALTHAIEAYTSVNCNTLTDCTAINAVELIFKSLNECYNNGKNIEAREDMVYAQYMAAMSFSNAGLGLVHAMSHQLSGLYNLAHGLCNAVLLPYIMEFNIDVNCKKYSEIAKKIGLVAKGMPDSVAAKRLILEVRKLNSKLDIPSTIKELKVKQEDFEKLANMAKADSSYPCNSKKASIQDIIDVYKKAYDGIKSR